MTAPRGAGYGGEPWREAPRGGGYGGEPWREAPGGGGGGVEVIQEGTLKEGIRLFKQKKWEQALKELLAVPEPRGGEGEHPDLVYYLGLCFAKMERYDDALFYLERVVTGGQDMLRVCQCRMALAYIYAVTGRYKRAEAELERLAEGGISSIQLYAAKAYAAWGQNRLREAAELYEKALKEDGNYATALNGLGYILADTSADVGRGLKLCKRAVSLRPGNQAYLDSLGWAYFKNGDMTEARAFLRRAMDAGKPRQEVRQHLQTVMGETDE